MGFSSFWEDTKATVNGFFISVEEGDPLPANVSTYWTGKTISEHVSTVTNFVERWAVYIIGIAALLVFLYFFLQTKARGLAK